MMKVATKTDKQLIEELEATRLCIAELEKVETKRKQVEEALKQSNRRFRDIVRNALEWIWEVDTEGKYTYSGPVVKKILGYKPSEVLGKHFYDLFHPDDREELKKAAFEVIAKKQPFRQFVNRNVHKNGKIVWLSTSGVPILDESGNLLGYRGADVDITERKQVEESLQAEKNKLQSVVNSLEYGLTIQDKDYNIIYQNESSRKASGGDHVGEKCYRVYGYQEKVCDGCPVKKAFKDGRSHTVERKQVRPSGEVRFWENTASPIRDAKGRIVSCLEVTRNITERKKQEQALADEATRRRLLVEQSSDGIVVLDENAKVYEANQRFAEMLGYTLEEVRELHTWDWDKNFPPEQLLEMGRNVDETGLHLETQHHRKDGSVIDVDISISGSVIAGQKLIFCVCRDITERKRAEEELQAEKNKLQSVIGAMEDGLTIQDKDYNIIYQNEPLKELFGDRLGEKCYRVYEDRGEVCDGCPVAKAFKDGKSHTAERKAVLPSGEVVFWENTANPIRDAKGKIVSCLEVIRNITERKQAEEELQTEKNKLQSVIGAMEDGLTIQDKNYNIIYQNEPSKKASGGDRLGEKCYRVYAFRDKVCEGCPVKKAFKDGKSHTLESKKETPSGEVVFWENTASPVRDAKGRIVSCLEVTRNVTERKQAEEELKQRAQMLDGATDSIFIHDPDDNFIYVNEAACRAHGYSRDEFMKMKITQVIAPEQLSDLPPIRQEIEEKGQITIESAHLRKDGSIMPVEVHSQIIESDGRKVFLDVIHDITERKQAEEELQAEKNKLQSVMDAMEDGLTIQDKNYNIIYQNELLKKLFGDRLGEKCYRVYEGREELCDGCPVKKAFKDGKSHTSERKVVMPSGEVNFWENTANPIRDAKGKIVSCLEVTRNITERKQAEEVLADEATRRRILVEQSRDGIVVLDEKGKVYEANQQFAEMLGYTPEEVRELYVWDWEAEFPREQVAEMIASVGPEGDHFETRHRRKDGTFYDVEISTNGAVIAGQKLVFCVCRDITERKRMEERLKESEEKYKTVTEDAPIGIYINDFTGKFLYGNKKAIEIVGYRRRELLGKNFLKLRLLDTKGIAKAVKLLALNKLGRATGPDEFVLKRKDGTKSIVEIRTRITTLGGKKVVLGMVEDVTERKQMQEALRGSEEKLRKMFESATDGISVIDLNGVITEVNREILTMHGFSSRAELVGKNALELIAPRDHDRVKANMRKALKQGTIKSVEYALLRADGSEFPGELSTSALKDAAGHWVGHVTISRDITERKQAERALIEAEEKYKNLVESVSDMIWETDEEGTFTFVSPRIKDTLGYEVDEVVGKRRTLDFTPKGEVQKWLARFKKITANRKSFSGFEITHIHKNGNPVIFETSGTPFYDNAGNFKGFVGLNKDITERKQAEQEIERQKAYFQQLFDNSPEGIALLDEADRFVKVNKGFETLFGYRGEEIKGRFINEVIVPEGYFEEASELSRLALRNQMHRKETVRKRRDGSLVAVDAIGYPIKFDNQTVGVYAIYSDITERKQAEKALKESQEFSSSLLENSPNPTFVVNPDTSVKYVNPAFEKLTGFTLDEITGIKAPYLWWPSEEREETTASFKNAMVTGGRKSERVFRKKNGERFCVAINSAPVMHEGKLIYFLVSWLDITDRKQAEEERIELEQKAHLASRLASVGEMAAGIAHEINNPMTAVIGFSQLLMDSDLPDDIKEDITVIHKEAQRAASVARNLLAFARKHTPTKQMTNINSIIEGVLKLRAYEQSVSNIRVNTRLDPDLPEVMADYSQLQQVFINIILNAEGAMLEANNGGTLTVTTQRVDDTVRASFADSGPGIAKENLNRIFDPFFTTKEVGKGTGLGLSVCHGIVAEHGGRIYARSKRGQGATFIVELPVNSRSSAGRN
jgi:PAS domain S-box-containing protein